MLADLRALEIVGAVQARAQHKMTLEQRFRANEDVVDFLLDRIHARPRWGRPGGITKPFLRSSASKAPAWLPAIGAIHTRNFANLPVRRVGRGRRTAPHPLFLRDYPDEP